MHGCTPSPGAVTAPLTVPQPCGTGTGSTRAAGIRLGPEPSASGHGLRKGFTCEECMYARTTGSVAWPRACIPSHHSSFCFSCVHWKAAVVKSGSYRPLPAADWHTPTGTPQRITPQPIPRLATDTTADTSTATWLVTPQRRRGGGAWRSSGGAWRSSGAVVSGELDWRVSNRGFQLHVQYTPKLRTKYDAVAPPPT